MDQSNRNQGSTKLAIKMGAAGGIGAVVLLGGALATAALASAFVVGRNCRSSEKHRPRTKIPPPDKTENPSNGAIKEAGVSENDTDFLVSKHTSTLDENPRVEENNLCDIETSEQSLCPIGPTELETDVMSDGFVTITEEKNPLLDERLQFEPQNEGPTPEQVCVEGGTAESKPTEQEAVEVITEKQPVQEDNDDVLLCCDHEEIKVVLVDNSVKEEVSIDDHKSEKKVNVMEEEELEEEKGSDNGEVIFSKTDIEDEQKTTLTVLDSFVGHANMSGDQKDGGATATETVEIVKECEFIEEKDSGMEHQDMNGDKEIVVKDNERGEEDNEMKYIEDHLTKEEEKCGEANEIIVIKKYEDPIEVTRDKVHVDITGCVANPMPEEEVTSVSPESIQITKNNENEKEVMKEDDAMDVEVVDESTEAVDFLVKEKVGEKGENVTKYSVDETVLSNQVQLSYREVEGKIQEDKAVKKVNYSGKSFVGKLSVLVADSSCSRRMMIVTVSAALSSISCSWFFGLSFGRLCLVMFLTMLLSSMVTE